ncbi:apolipoprotein acyltransferase [Jannaschia sp. S6380]|uniref:apolipoprotein acyltransferase n=1 Tax=Jannaschia sp. S6380 TaxID=2926408 RepID=UPI001FF103A8|nr:apolipoprotein acyltransferase [Jannaschia sp. S6380]MCK0167368.1 apolipoprotein acyltransferase [Jannaschia sp. S6380]
MLPIVTALIGALLGALTARRRRGNGFDIAQWAAVWAIMGGLIGLLALIVLARI